jgi:protein FRA10AC1
MEAYYKPKENRLVKTDLDILREHYQFLLDDEDEASERWEMRMVQAYHDKLFKEYCLADLSRVHEPGAPIGMRWRTEAEVISGRGQFSCGSLACDQRASLTSWELHFGYVEKGIKKNALVKLRLCPACSEKLPLSQRNKPTSDDLMP